MEEVQVSVNHKSDVEKDITVSIGSKEVKKQYDMAYRLLRGQLVEKGFRKGKIPRSIIEAKYKSEMKNLVDMALLNMAFGKAITDNDFELVGSPDIKKFDYALDGSYNVDMYIEVKPKFEPQEYLGMILKKNKELNIDEAVEKRIKTFQNRAAEINEVEREVRLGDTIYADLDGKIDGEKFDGGTVKGAQFEVGAGLMMEDFENKIVGMKAGEEKNVKIKFLEDYKNKEVAGKEVDFYIKIFTVCEKKLHEANDELAKKFAYGTLDRMKENIKEEIETEHEQANRMRYEEQIIDKLIGANKFSVPKKMIQLQVDNIVKQVKEQFNYQEDPAEEIMEGIRESAERQLRRMLLLEKIYGEEKDNMKDISVHGEIVERLAKWNKMTKDEYIKSLEPFDLFMKVREENVIDFILEKAEFGEVEEETIENVGSVEKKENSKEETKGEK